MLDRYKKQVELLIRIMPAVFKIDEFAVHGGTAINLFYSNLPRYSVDIDLTYIPIEDRDASFKKINSRLLEIKADLERTIPGIRVQPEPDVLKLLCTFNDATVKIEVNGTKRGIIGDTVIKPLCERARQEFNMGCKARTVSFSQLYGGKIVAALSRQHPRDLFDCHYMDLKSFDYVRDGFMLCLLGSDKPTIEVLNPNEIDQANAIEKQFNGMSDLPFGPEDYKRSREELIKMIHDSITDEDKSFFLSFEQGEPSWNLCFAGDLSVYPSVQWKLLNIQRLKNANPDKFKEGLKKLEVFLQRL